MRERWEIERNHKTSVGTDLEGPMSLELILEVLLDIRGFMHELYKGQTAEVQVSQDLTYRSEQIMKAIKEKGIPVWEISEGGHKA